MTLAEIRATMGLLAQRPSGDIESDHGKADDLLIDALSAVYVFYEAEHGGRLQDIPAIIDWYHKVEKWYA